MNIFNLWCKNVLPIRVEYILAHITKRAKSGKDYFVYGGKSDQLYGGDYLYSIKKTLQVKGFTVYGGEYSSLYDWCEAYKYTNSPKTHLVILW